MNAMNESNWKLYFDLQNTILEENDVKSHPEKIYNTDESGSPWNPQPPKVMALRGQIKVRYLSSESKSQITTLGHCNGIGKFVFLETKQMC